MWVTNSTNPPSHRFQVHLLHNPRDWWLWCLIAFCLCLQDEDQQREKGVASGDQDRLKNTPAAGGVEGKTAPQGQSMGGWECGLLKTTDNLHTLTYRGGRGFHNHGPFPKATCQQGVNGEPKWGWRTCSTLASWLHYHEVSAAEQRAFTTGLGSTSDEQIQADEQGQRRYRWK